MYGQNYNRYGSSTLQRPGGVDVDELRQRRAMREDRMAPMGVLPRPEAPEPPPQEESPLAKMITQFSGMAAQGIMNNADDREDAPQGARTPPFAPQAASSRPMPNPDQLWTPPFAPSRDRTMMDWTKSPISEQQNQMEASRQPRTATPRPARPTYDPTVNAPAPRVGGIPGTDYGDDSGYGVPIPSIPGTGGGPRPYDPIEKARYEAAMSNAKTAKPIDPNNPETFYQPLREKRSFWEGLKGAGLGALQGFLSTGSLGGALGGAVTGGVIRGVNPMLGRAMQFDMFQRPQMEQDMIRQMQLDQFMRQRQAEQLGQRKTQAEIARIEAETQAIPGQEELRRANIQSNIDYRKSRTQQPAKPRGNYRLEPGQDGRMYRIDLDTGQATPVEGFTPPAPARAGRGGGGGGGRAAAEPRQRNLPSAAIEEYRNVLTLKSEAEQAAREAAAAPKYTRNVFGMQKLAEGEMSPEERQARAAQALQEYNDAVDRLGQLFPELYETGPGVTPEGAASPWKYAKRRQ